MKTYWNNKGRHQVKLLKIEELVPAAGPCKFPRSKNKHLERFRRACNAYYDVYNNGGGNRDSSIRYWFGMARHEIWDVSPKNERHMEKVMDELVLNAYEEQFPLDIPRKNLRVDIMKITINAKCCDRFYARLERDNGEISEYDGYVPDFFPGQHYGDYVELEIDVKTGKILNWTPPTEEDLKIFEK